MPKRTTIVIPIDLARLLVSEPEDHKDPEKYSEVQAVAKALLRLLMRVEEHKS